MLLENITSYAKIDPLTDIPDNFSVGHVVSVSGNVAAGDLFVAIEGLHSDGHDFVSDAVDAGASAIVVSKGRGKDYISLGIPVFEAEDTRETLSFLHDALNGFPSEKLKIIAVTGTNGKTSISYMLFSIMRRAGISCGLIGTSGCFLNSEKLSADPADSLANMTTPDPAELYYLLGKMSEEKASYVIMEATSHASALGKLAPLAFTAVIFSNLTPDHLDFHGDMENYYRAKYSIVNSAELAVVNADDAYGRRMLESLPGIDSLSVSTHGRRADYRAENVHIFGVEGMCFTLCGDGKRTEIQLPIIGEFNVSNSLLAAACAAELGIPMSCIKNALESFSGVPGRMQKVRTDCGVPFSVFIDYAHTPDALENVLSTFLRIKPLKGRLVLLFGCGGDRDRSKRPMMGKIASAMADFVVVTSDNSRSESPGEIIFGIVSGFPANFDKYIIIKDRKKAIEYAIMNARDDDVIILAGKGHEKYEIRSGIRLPFDEEQIVKEACLEYKQKLNQDGF